MLLEPNRKITNREISYFLILLLIISSVPSVHILNIWALPLPITETEETGVISFKQEIGKSLTNLPKDETITDLDLVRVSNNHALDSNTGESSGCPPALFAGDSGEGEAINYGNFINLISGKGLNQWVSVEPSDLPVIAEGKVLEFELATNDVPINHNSHDIVWKIALDNPKYSHLAPDFQISKEKEKELKIEWEIKNFNDPGVWPFEGDRAWILGKWIFDCAHVEPGEKENEGIEKKGDVFRTEIHPPQAVAFTRQEPFIFSGNNYPSDAVKTFIFINGQGGYYNTNVGGENGNYAFDIDLPPKPSSESVLRTQILFPDGGLMPVLSSFSASQSQTCHISAINTIACTKIHVYIPYSTIPASEKNSYAAIVVAGWDDGILKDQKYSELQVTFDSIEIVKCVGCDNNGNQKISKTGCDSPDTRIMLGAVNGKYRILSGYGVQSPLLSSCEGQKIDLNMKFPPTIVKDDSSLKIRTTGYEQNNVDDYFGCGNSELYDHAGELHCLGVGWSLIGANDKLCDLKVDLTAENNFGVKYSSDGDPLLNQVSCSNENDEVKLNYHVTELQKFSSDS